MALRESTLSRERSCGAGLPFSNPEVGGAGSIEVYVLPERVSMGALRAHDTHPFSDMDAEWCALPSGELSHSILASAISQVSRTERFESFRYRLRTGMEDSNEMAPMASAAYSILAESMDGGDRAHLVPDHRVLIRVRQHFLQYG